MAVDPAEHGRRANAWRYGEGTMWGQDEVWVTGAGDAIPVEDIQPDHLNRIIRRNEQGSNADIIEGTPLMRRLRELDNDDS
ncbi:hypothetical protein E3O42_10225 [Cryobacterium adonitolivorans]|uniref:Uncharacterized protein n=1 Tax=Cryobacterium adonitolivorans TaxID=1259189 RepID=A0A4R8W2Y9_9MICO|nr:hypothetical protein [Cryobacterium adonitolivorans]TFC01484.1 hypothetical protein E3O42_10225 [Cryobacterium adonitolivorans]